MEILDSFSLGGWDWLLLPLGAVLLFAASNAIVGSLGGDSASTRARAAGYWLPIAATAIVAVWARHWELAVFVIFSTSVGCLALVVGSVLLTVAPPADREAPGGFPVALSANQAGDGPQAVAAKTGTAGLQRLWPFIVPAGLISLIGGFSGHLDLADAGALLIEGMVLAAAWTEIMGTGMAAGSPAKTPIPRIHRHLHIISFALALLTVIVGAMALNAGSGRLLSQIESQATGVLVGVVVTPILLAPLLISAMGLTHRGLADSAITTAVAVALLNLCLLLPLCILMWYPASYRAVAGATTHPSGFAALASPVFPLIAWRVDNVVLLLLGFMLIPAAMGRWTLRRAEGVTLIGLYMAYVLIERWAANLT